MSRAGDAVERMACDAADRLDALRTLVGAGAEPEQLLAVLSDARRIVSQIMAWTDGQDVAPAEQATGEVHQ